jgi:hypothetical protein
VAINTQRPVYKNKTAGTRGEININSGAGFDNTAARQTAACSQFTTDNPITGRQLVDDTTD